MLQMRQSLFYKKFGKLHHILWPQNIISQKSCFSHQIEQKQGQLSKQIKKTKNEKLLQQIRYDKQKMDELDFNSILSGQGKKHPQQTQAKPSQKKMTQTQTRARQQSCMISQVDKNLLPSGTQPVNPTNFRVSLSDMLNIDKHDQSLEQYKKSLLGEIKEDQLKEDQAAQVEIVKVEVICPDRPGGNITLDFNKKQRVFQIKEGCVYRLRIHFVVRFDIVHGLKYVNNVYKLFARVDQEQQKMGSFAPQPKPHTFDLSWTEAPTGLLARGEYKGKGLFLDGDGIVHCQFNYICKIASDW